MRSELLPLQATAWVDLRAHSPVAMKFSARGKPSCSVVSEWRSGLMGWYACDLEVVITLLCSVCRQPLSFRLTPQLP